jgi:hypothetical protein
MNDESNRSNQGQGFVRRPIPKYNEDKTSGGGGYQGQGGYTPRYNSGYGSDRQRDDSQQSSYSGASRRDGGRPDRGGSGGYNSGYGGGSGYKSGGYGYNRNNNYGSGDRAVKQNDIIIQLLKEIRDRLPAPPQGTPIPRASDSYSSRHSSGGYDYNSGGDDKDGAEQSGINGNSAVGGGEDAQDEEEFDPGN